MIRITVELVPLGEEKGATIIETIYVVNRGNHPKRPDFGNYTVRFGSGREVEVKDHHRSLGYRPILALALGVLNAEDLALLAKKEKEKKK